MKKKIEINDRKGINDYNDANICEGQASKNSKSSLNDKPWNPSLLKYISIFFSMVLGAILLTINY